MRTGLIGVKVGNSSFYSEDGIVTPITLVKVEECIVSAIKTKDKDGYFAVQLASIDKASKDRRINKAQKKLFSKINIAPKKVVKEFRVIEENLLELGSSIKADHFEKNQKIDVTSISIGKGFAGPMKRHNLEGLELHMVFLYRTDLMDRLEIVKILEEFLKEKKWQAIWVIHVLRSKI